MVFEVEGEELPVTIRIDEKIKPEFKLDAEGKRAEINIKLEGELISAPKVEGKSKTVEDREKECSRYITDACNDFIKRIYTEMDVDILGVRGKLKRRFLDNKDYNKYIKNFRAKDWKFSINTDLSIKRAGMTY